jgi:RNA polymerase sporulation-specific sigma factor
MFFSLIHLILDNLLLMALHIENTVKYAKPFTPEEETRIFARMTDPKISHTEFVKLRNEVVLHNMRLVALIAKRYYGSDVDAETLHECGFFALIKAAGSYMPAKNIKFATYATKCIANEMLMQIRTKTKLGRETSIDSPIEEDKDGNTQSWEDKLADRTDIVDDIDTKLKSQQLHTFITEELTPREQLIIAMRYGIGGKREQTQREIAAKLKISRSYVSRIEKKCLAKLHKRFDGSPWLDGIK